MRKFLTFYSSDFFRIITLFLFISNISYSQWEWLNPKPQGNQLNSVSFTDSLHGTAVGQVGVIIRTNDGGINWQLQSSGVNTHLFGVSFTDADNGTAVGAQGVILRTNNGGVSWTQQQSGITTALRGVFFTDANNGWAVGAQGIILKTSNGGLTWVNKNSGTTAFLYSASFTNSLIGTVVGATGKILRTIDGGDTWTSQSSGTNEVLWSVCMTNQTHGTAVGGNQTIRRTTDGGTTWIPQTSVGYMSTLYGVSFVDENNGWIAGDYVQTIQHTTDGGATWHLQVYNLYPHLRAISFISTNFGVAVGYVGAILGTNDGGSNWKNQVQGTQNVLGPVVFTSPNVGYVGGTYGLIEKTTDGGLTWIEQNSGISQKMFYGMYFVNENVGTAVSAGGDIVRTTNGGSNWNIQTSGTTDFLYGVAFTDINHGFVSGGASFLSTTDGGTTWVPISSGLTSTAGISFGDSLNGTVVGSGIIHTTDGGLNWSPQSSGTSNYLWSVHFIDAINGWAVGDAGTIIRTTNGGVNWTTQTSNTTNDLWGIRFFNNKVGTAVGDLGVILQTSNGGANWLVQQSPTANFLNSVTYPSSNKCIIVGEGGVILSHSVTVLPSIPTNLTAIADTFKVTLSWQDNSDNEDGFIIERKDGDSTSTNPFIIIDTVAANVTAFVDYGLSANSTYTYQVYAYNEFGNSGNSNIAQTTTIIPVELTSFSVLANSDDIELKWTTATEMNNQGFQIERRKTRDEKSEDWESIGFVPGFGTTTEPKSYSFVDSKVSSGTYIYRLKQIDFDGTYKYSNEVSVEVTLPLEYSLDQNYPNPFNPSTTIKYSIPEDGFVKLSVYNMLGEEVSTLVNGNQEAGRYELSFNASELSSGVYVYRLEAPNYTSSKKLILLK